MRLGHAVKGLITAASLAGLGLNAQAQSNPCEASQTLVAFGSPSQTNTTTLTNIGTITTVEILEESTSWSTCSLNKFLFTDNVFTTLPGCRATFKITGEKANCSPEAPTGISQLPLFLTSQSSPNIMFLMDDSGSTHWELMPDQAIHRNVANGDIFYLFPRADGIYGGTEYANNVATVDNVAFNARARSPQQNSIYYNPGTTYEPWIKADGTTYPDANPECALHHPERVGIGPEYCRNLVLANTNYNSNDWRSCDAAGTCNIDTAVKFFWPATYFWQQGDDPWDFGSYKKTEIRPIELTYRGEGRQNRRDCDEAGSAKCTYTEEIRNFANWYTYYRSRALAARAAAGYAFVEQTEGLRVGYGTLNTAANDVDGVSTKVISTGVRSFVGKDKEKFYNKLYKDPFSRGGTPLRRALDTAGQYFLRTDNDGPWSAKPGTSDATPHLSCRRSYTVLMTDGYWSGGSNHEAGTAAARENNDGTNGPSHVDVSGGTAQYVVQAPFSDALSNTLADVAMHYWKNDLRPDLKNNVPVLARNPAYWQHMSTFGIGLGVKGSVDPATAKAAVKTGEAIAWPDPSPATGSCTGAICNARIDDLLHAGINSRGGFFSANDPKEFAKDLAAVLNAISVDAFSSAAAIATNSTKLNTNTVIYQARFDTRDWSGQLVAYDLNPDGSLKSTIWDTDDSGSIPAHTGRNVFTAIGDSGVTSTLGIAFSEANYLNLTAYQQNALSGGGTEQDGKDTLNWLRGDQSKESETGLRVRNKLLGDIVNSDPIYVGDTENFGFSVLPGTEGTSYAAFRGENGKLGRRQMLYVGGNDGMLHGFDAKTGKEVFGYIPLGVYDNLNSLTKNDYVHQYFVDGSPLVSDAYISSSWRSVLVGATGAGGKSVFALDVTKPDSVNASSLLWEFSTSDAATDKLGVAMSAPTIVRLKANDKWVAIFGNGYNSNDNVKLMIVDLATGALLKAIDTGATGFDNGLASIVPVDTNADRITDYVYAGDLVGNLWKFDLTDNSMSGWRVAYSAGPDPAPVFKAVDRDGNPQPITTRPVVGRHAESGLMIYFGTGQFFEVGDELITNNPQVQTFYGIRDDGNTVSRSQLLEQTIIFEGFADIVNDTSTTADDETTKQSVRVISNNGAGSAASKGWRLDLISPSATNGNGERVVSSPVLRADRIIFSSTIPNPDSCGYGGTSWLMEINAQNGGRLDYSAFDMNDDMFFTDGDFIEVNGEYLPVSGLGQDDIIEAPSIVSAGDVEYKFVAGSSGRVGVTREKGSNTSLGRQSWRQLK